MNSRERFKNALACEPVDRLPVWFMRQAGRYLPEYRELRAKHSFEECYATPQLAAELTLQPMRRFAAIDAAVLFSDILVPFAGMGRPATFEEGGPRVAHPVRTPEDVDSLRAFDPDRDAPFVAQALRLVRAALPDRAVLGFAGAPFTLATYLVEGGSPGQLLETKKFAYRHGAAWERLLALCADAAAAHLVAQAKAGVDAVQLFDTWAEALSAAEFADWEAPRVAKIVRAVKPLAPVIYFARGSAHLLPHLRDTKASAHSIDWRASLETARAVLGPHVALQGNLDPTLLFAPRERLVAQTRKMRDALDGRGHVFNTGHGLIVGTPIESVEAVLAEVAR